MIELNVADLLERPPIMADENALRATIEGRRVLVTGAGGSIGSELCRQIVRLRPSALLMMERYENSLHDVMLSVAGTVARPFLGDILDARRLDNAFRIAQPDIVFHAAAHKHVSLVELQPSEAVRNNVTGTRLVAAAAGRFGARQFVLVSSDKAVRPSCVMGATKRAAELLISETSRHWPSTAYVSVRFGNVLGSNGSVVPLFAQQIRDGGPLTVTHPDVRRFFMLISEAVQFLIQVAAIGRSGDIYILELGEPIRIVDLARRMLRIAGRNYPIEFTGLRHGEKMSEELVGTDEVVEPTIFPRVGQIRSSAARLHAAADLDVLETLAADDSDAGVIEQLCHIVPTFTPSAAAMACGNEEPPPIRELGFERVGRAGRI